MDHLIWIIVIIISGILTIFIPKKWHYVFGFGIGTLVRMIIEEIIKYQ